MQLLLQQQHALIAAQQEQILRIEKNKNKRSNFVNKQDKGQAPGRSIRQIQCYACHQEGHVAKNYPSNSRKSADKQTEPK